ncbi:MAG: hypothetical protein IJ200_00800 [Prevotella sp.]|nr:hypothetical protein [Prevotella sp.]
MKKTYRKPSMEEVKIKAATLLAGSIEAKSEKQATEWGARRGWFDDDEE